MSVFVIAEAGVNHNGDVQLGLELVDAAAATGADAVKFQTFRASALVTPAAPKAAYQERQTGSDGSQLDLLRRLELSFDAHKTLLARCRERGISFLSTPFDLQSLAFLVKELQVERLKIGSGDLTNAPLLLAAGRSGRPVILSTGMATIDEIERALAVLAFGYAGGATEHAGQAAFDDAFASRAGRDALAANVTLLHCTTEYPAPVAEANLRAMGTMRHRFGLPVGLSDHTEGIAVATAAVALGATVIEKHLTLDRAMPGPDHAASLEPREFRALVDAVRTVEVALGTGEKIPSPSEFKNRVVARKSLVTQRAVAKGEMFNCDNLGTLRPGDGIPALEYFDWLGRAASRDFAAGEKVSR